MITDGFCYVAVLLFLAAVWVTLEANSGLRFFRYVPAVVLIYLSGMILCSMGLWNLDSTQTAYDSLKNSLTYAMVFTMLLRCDVRRIARLGHKMLLGFFCAAFSIMAGFVLSYAGMKRWIGSSAWRGLGALCGSWLGGAGNMMAIQSALEIRERDMGYALVMDSVNYAVWLGFLLWILPMAPRFNRWTRSDTQLLDRVSQSLAEEKKENPVTFQSLLLILGCAFLVSAGSQKSGSLAGQNLPFLDGGTWTVFIVTGMGLLAALTPLGKISGANELSNLMLYLIVALLASRASLREMSNAPAWIMTGFLILGIHGIGMICLCRLFRLDLFTGAVASLANIGGAASAPILAGSYSGSLVPVGILMSMLGYLVGTPLGLLTARIMEKISVLDIF